SNQGVDDQLAAEEDSQLVLRCMSAAGGEEHRRRFLPVTNQPGGGPISLEASEGRARDEIEPDTFDRTGSLGLGGRSAPRNLSRAGARASPERLVSVAAAACGSERGRTRMAIQVETELQSIAVQTKDPVVPVPRLRSCDEFDVDLVRLRL